MLKTKVGYSENTDSFASGVETAQMANVIENPQVGLLFTSCVQDQKELIIYNKVKMESKTKSLSWMR